ncbi:23460_t:CDS:1 [Dentiscutata erythropus]|uniref:23460_t:CDS:1 n=1 Tax=Dentiscutata erythropus TaxID=1348616 RepID=A0A9N9HP66_9GLOM|nr:23460_t:CDS:1 [Dentiscutata erythropus]
MFRPLHQTTIRTPAFVRTSNFSTSLPGLGRGGSGPISLGGKTFTFGEKLWIKQGRDILPKNSKNLSPQPGQFDDAEEERKALHTLSEKLIYGDGERELGRESSYRRPPGYGIDYQRQKSRNNSRDTQQRQTGTTRVKPNVLSTASKKKQHKHIDNLNQIQAKEFIVEDINWSNFTASQPTSLESKEEEAAALRLELKGGDYDRYLSVPASVWDISEKDKVANQFESIQLLIGQNPSYNLSDKKVFYETLARSLKPLTETKKNS